MIQKAYIRDKDKYCIYIIEDNVLIVFYELDGNLIEHRTIYSDIVDHQYKWQSWTINHTMNLITRTNPPRTAEIWSYQTTYEYLIDTVPKHLNDITPHLYHAVSTESLQSDALSSQILSELRKRGSLHEIEKPQEERLAELESSLSDYIQSVKELQKMLYYPIVYPIILFI